MSKKFGVVGVVTALLLAFAAFGLQSTEKASAIISSLTITTPVGVSGSGTITAIYVDDTPTGGGADIDVSLPLSGTAATITTVACTGTAAAGRTYAGTPITTAASTGTDICTVTDDTDTVAQTVTVSITFTCVSAGTVRVTLNEGGTTSTQTLTCGQGLTAAAFVETNDGTATGTRLTSLETHSVCSSDLSTCLTPNQANIAVRVQNSAGADVAGIEVLGLITSPATNGGILESTTSVTASSNITETVTGVLGAGGWEACTNATTDATPAQEEVNSAVNTVGYAQSAATTYSLFTYCATPGTTLGSVTLTFIAVSNTAGEADVILTQVLTVVGPTATLTIAGSPSTLVCGEKATITVNVKDAIGQNVSNNTLVNLVTNYGGVLPGTAVPTLIGNVNAANGTVAGAVNAFLLTSTQNVGPYEVVASVAGPSGTIFAQTTVTCTAAVAPAVSAPSTGTAAVRPPSTGDAGLATESSSWASFALAGLVAFAIAGLATVKFARR